MDRIRLKDKEFELFIPEEEIKDAIAKVAERIREDVKGTNPLFVGILNGAFMFTAELMRQLNEPYEITFARYSSYKGTSFNIVITAVCHKMFNGLSCQWTELDLIKDYHRFLLRQTYSITNLQSIEHKIKV